MVQKSKKQLVIKIGCVIAAFILWLYTSNEDINKVYKISNIPIEVINEDYLMQSGLIISPNQEFTTSLKVTGKPSEVYSAKPSQFRLVADLSVYALKRGENRIPITIVKRPGNNINIINDNNMWISVKVDKYVEKNVPVEVKLDGDFKEGFFSGEPIIKNKNALISGAEEYVSTVKKAVAEVKLDKPNKNIETSVPLKAVDKSGEEVKEVVVKPKLLEVGIPIQKTKQVGITIKTTGKVSSDYILKEIKLSKEKIKITGDPKDLIGIKSLETETIDLSTVKDERVNIKTKLVIPENVKIIDGDQFINAQVSLDKIIQKNITTNIEIKNLAANVSVKLDKDTISLVVSGGTTSINQLGDKKIKCYINLEALKTGDYTTPITIELPQGISIISQSSKFTKVNISEKKDDTETSISKDKDNDNVKQN